MPRTGKPENLKPVRTKEEARKRGKNGGIASGKARREKRLMSSIMLEFLQKKHKIVIDKEAGITKEMDAKDLVMESIAQILFDKNSASVSLMKTMGEQTEGKHLKHTGGDGEPLIPNNFSGLTKAERSQLAAMLAKVENE